jgi:hypothetical protein
MPHWMGLQTAPGSMHNAEHGLHFVYTLVRF